MCAVLTLVINFALTILEQKKVSLKFCLLSAKKKKKKKDGKNGRQQNFVMVCMWVDFNIPIWCDTRKNASLKHDRFSEIPLENGQKSFTAETLENANFM